MNRTVVAILAAGAVLVSVPWLGLPPFYESLLYLACHWVILATSWNILSGYSGYFSFGHGAFFGVGMYAAAVVAGKLGWPFLASLPIAAIAAAGLGVALGAVVFRVKAVRGELFALLTLAITFVIATIVINTPIDGGPGVYLNSVETPRLGPSPASSIYVMAALVAVGTVLASWLVQRSKLGTGLFAIHDDEDVAEVMGVPTYRYKLVALALSGALAGVAGAIHALFVQYVTVSETFNITVPLTVVLMSILGGSRHWAGPMLGAIFITGLLYYFTAGNHPLLGKAAVGVILVAVILFMPEGFMGWFRKLWPIRRVRASAGARADDALIPNTVPAGQPLLRVRGLGKHFRGVRALDGVDLEVRRGEILGLLGPNGSGKSTFINVVSGHFPPTMGEVEFEGRRIESLSPHEIAHAGIARTYQIPRPFAHLTVLENVALVAHFGSAGLTREQAEREAWTWLEFIGLTDKAHSLPDDINLHQRKFLELARALAARPRLVMLDEVLSGLTPGEINEAIELIRKIRDRGSTIVFVEHVMRAVMALADRVIVFNHGQLLAQGLPHEVMDDPEVVRAYLGSATSVEAVGQGKGVSNA